MARGAPVIDVIMPTLGHMGDLTANSLHHLPWPYNLITCGERIGWGQAINKCLEQRVEGRDAIIIDDDVQLLPETFEGFERYLPYGHIFGFKLYYPSGGLQHDGGWVSDEGGAGHIFSGSDSPSYVAYITTSLSYFKSELFDIGMRFPEWPGYQWEDVAFCLEAERHIYNVVYVPLKAYHHETATKRHLADWGARFNANWNLFKEGYLLDCRRLAAKFGPSRRILLNAT